MVKNVRLVVCTVVNLGACTAVSGLAMYIVGRSMVVSTLAPSMMLAVAMAMSIDYSLFLLSRFRHEVAAGRAVVDAVAVMVATSGKIVLVSGCTLLLCFAMMLVLPVSLIRSLGVSAAVTVFMAVVAALTLTPASILIFPRFFSSTRRFGFTSDGVDCSGCRRCSRPGSGAVETSGGGGGGGGGLEVMAEYPRRGSRESYRWQHRRSLPSGLARELPVAASTTSAAEQLCKAEEELMASVWCRFGRLVQRRWAVVLVVLLLVAVPIGAIALSEFKIAIGLLPLLPRGGAATHTLIGLEDAFGGSAIFPTTIVVIPPANATATAAGRARWLRDTCHELQSVAQWVDPGGSAPPFSAAAFAGSMMVNGTCVSDELVPKFIGGWSEDGSYAATTVLVTYRIDPFGRAGQDWMQQLRNATGSGAPTARTGNVYHITSEGATEMDAARETFERFPLMIGLMMTAVLVLIGGSFGSIVAPIRAVFCLLWMLTVTMGLSIFTFQSGMLDGLGVAQFAGRPSGAMSWFSPSIALPILIGLGLDYDIFYTEKVAEEREHGHGEKEASVRALAATANLISAAGAIMVVAFMSVLLSGTAALNEIAFMLTVGILIDCFIVRKLTRWPPHPFFFFPSFFGRSAVPRLPQCRFRACALAARLTAACPLPLAQTTKIIIPASIGLTAGRTFWPRRFEREQPAHPSGARGKRPVFTPRALSKQGSSENDLNNIYE